ncbi:Ras GTPase [Heterostelium album PN500]|uniref:small monomeric GTPase n=1 Tax=Heterostelium pallidum (strain ATCC 26659 / Pp 5 / PN500) TaxID=670386 RepID=D3BKD7_HETP5|nr:Ras GTPase [Heterostelium album PN500]EFA78367.1 Ras GTPase [Heterostelium album PN500]|eukprot:XP_020430492.1 Ras GTPase [Heterostelium album PN500]
MSENHVSSPSKSKTTSAGGLHNNLKICVLGDGGVGKTSITIQLCSNHFVEYYDPTIEDSYRKQVVIDEEACILDILDTAGQEELTAMRDQWIRSCEGFIIVYTITSRSSFDQVTLFKEQVSRVLDKESVPIMLVGNKCDLEHLREVTLEEGKDLAKCLGMLHMEASARTRHNVEESFYELVREMRRRERGIKDQKKDDNKSKSKFKTMVSSNVKKLNKIKTRTMNNMQNTFCKTIQKYYIIIQSTTFQSATTNNSSTTTTTNNNNLYLLKMKIIILIAVTLALVSISYGSYSGNQGPFISQFTSGPSFPSLPPIAVYQSKARIVELKSEAGYPNIWQLIINIDTKKFQFLTMRLPMDVDQEDIELLNKTLSSGDYKTSADRSTWFNRSNNLQITRFSIRFLPDDKMFEFYSNSMVPQFIKDVANLLNKYAQKYLDNVQAALHPTTPNPNPTKPTQPKDNPAALAPAAPASSAPAAPASSAPAAPASSAPAAPASSAPAAPASSAPASSAPAAPAAPAKPTSTA